MNGLADLLQPQQTQAAPQSGTLFSLISKLLQMGVPHQLIPLMVHKLMNQGVSDSALPQRGMLPTTNPAMPNTTIPNAYRGPLQPPGALPPQSPTAYPDWQTKI